MKKISDYLLVLFVFFSCENNPLKEMEYKVDVQGHRGARAIMPENTIEGFIYALQQGVTTLEMDVVITQDSQVILSHEPWMGHEICLNLDGNAMDEIEALHHNIYEMNYAEVKKYDCGSKSHPRFPNQKNFPVHKPLLAEVIDAVEKFISEKNIPKVFYNIETKCTPEGDNIFHPAPDVFCELLMNVLKEKNMTERTTIQSFDVRTLQYIHANYPEMKTVLLIENELSPEMNLEQLGFVPFAYSPYYALVNDSLKIFCEEKNMQLIPWTVNDSVEIYRMLDLKAHGIISDNPALVIQLLKQRNIKTILEP